MHAAVPLLNVLWPTCEPCGCVHWCQVCSDCLCNRIDHTCMPDQCRLSGKGGEVKGVGITFLSQQAQGVCLACRWLRSSTQTTCPATSSLVNLLLFASLLLPSAAPTLASVDSQSLHFYLYTAQRTPAQLAAACMPHPALLCTAFPCACRMEFGDLEEDLSPVLVKPGCLPSIGTRHASTSMQSTQQLSSTDHGRLGECRAGAADGAGRVSRGMHGGDGERDAQRRGCGGGRGADAGGRQPRPRLHARAAGTPRRHAAPLRRRRRAAPPAPARRRRRCRHLPPTSIRGHGVSSSLSSGMQREPI